VRIDAVSWNLFHGRDKPPHPALFSWRSRLLKITERGPEYAQVNRSLFAEFATALAGLRWDVALLQETPPRWAPRLVEALGAESHLVLTSRNQLAPLSGWAADLNPDLVASWDGGSNLTLLRGALLSLHATNDRPELAGPEVVRAAETAIEWAEGAALLFGGDLNLRPAEQPDVFDQLHDLGLERPTGPRSIDHLLARGMKIVEPPAPLEPVEIVRPPDFHGPAGLWRREAGRRLRLSDHAPVAAQYELAV
jgi:hypothetical protein